VLVIRDAQFEAMQAIAESALLGRVAAHVAAREPEPSEQAPPTGPAQVALAIERARAHGLRRERALAEFAARWLASGGAIEADPRAAEVLARVAADANPDARWLTFDLELEALRR